MSLFFWKPPFPPFPFLSDPHFRLSFRSLRTLAPLLTLLPRFLTKNSATVFLTSRFFPPLFQALSRFLSGNELVLPPPFFPVAYVSSLTRPPTPPTKANPHAVRSALETFPSFHLFRFLFYSCNSSQGRPQSVSPRPPTPPSLSFVFRSSPLPADFASTPPQAYWSFLS